MTKPITSKVSIIILNWNKPELTLECLKSVSQLSVVGYQLSVVVVDNGSTDDSVKKLDNFKIPKAEYKLLENKENMGFAEGNNVGIRHAMENAADFVLIINNDTILDKNLVVELLKAAQKNPRAALITPKIYFAKGYEFHKKRYKRTDLGKVIWSAGGDIDWNNVYGKNHGVDEVDTGQFDEEMETAFATGACLFVRVEALKEVGLFDPNYYMYFEDADLSLKAKKKGWKVLYTPKAVIWHKVAQSSKIGGELNDYFITRNRLYFGMKYAPIRAKIALLKESFILTSVGRNWQIKGATDFYLRRFGKGSWK